MVFGESVLGNGYSTYYLIDIIGLNIVLLCYRAVNVLTLEFGLRILFGFCCTLVYQAVDYWHVLWFYWGITAHFSSRLHFHWFGTRLFYTSRCRNSRLLTFWSHHHLTRHSRRNCLNCHRDNLALLLIWWWLLWLLAVYGILVTVVEVLGAQGHLTDLFRRAQHRIILHIRQRGLCFLILLGFDQFLILGLLFFCHNRRLIQNLLLFRG